MVVELAAALGLLPFVANGLNGSQFCRELNREIDMPTSKWIKKLDWPVIRENAEEFRLDPDIIAAVIQTESANNYFTCKYEPAFRYTFQISEFARALGTDYSTMEMMQKTSWGPMHVMGATALAMGLAREPLEHLRWPPALMDRELGVRYGSMYLRGQADRFGADPATLYAAYNGGSPRKLDSGMFENQHAVNRFIRIFREIKDYGSNR